MDQEEQARRPVAQLIAPGARRGGAARQRGWAGALAMLLALLIVLVLAAAALRKYGLPAAPAPATADSGARGEPPVDAGGDAPAPKSAMDRARGLEDSVREQAAEMQKRLDAADQ